mgnify:FL=1
MSVYKQMIKVMDDCDIESYLDMLHPDYVFVRHQSGQEVSKKDWSETVTGMFNAMKDGKLSFDHNRCLYENEDILVIHNIGTFPDGTKEAIMAVHTLSDGKVIKTESGATPLT